MTSQITDNKREEARELHNLINDILWDHKYRKVMNPSLLATVAMKKIGAASLGKSHPLLYQACHRTFQQIAEELMEVADARSAAQLRAEGQALLRHAAALEVEMNRKFPGGDSV